MATTASVTGSSTLHAVRRPLTRGSVLAVALVVTTQVAVASPAGGPGIAEVTSTAERGIAWDPGASCDVETIGFLSQRHPNVEQFVLITTEDFSATSGSLEVVARDRSGSWRCQHAPVAARVGRNGTRPLADRRSGDGTAPAGVFPLGSVQAWDGQEFQFFGNRPDPGVRGSYRDVRYEDCWGATPGEPTYQQLIDRPGCPGPDDEWLPRFGDVYAHAAVIGANLDPISGNAPGEPALAAAIFLHRHSYDPDGSTRATSGCVSVELAALRSTLRLIDPALDPHFAIGPRSWLGELR